MLTLMTALAMTLQSAPAVAGCRFGRVTGTAQDARVWIYRQPTIGAKKIARLRPGEGVFACGENGGWLWIRYADGRHSCGGIAGATVRYASTCANGWIDRRRVLVIAR